ncbi:hypothetical protein GGU10DRAFT_26054 [Lentinula aff. detonsa]|uniref:DUF6533 domain-containing protein n=1 Tax=Lentinula aff. detonsa TaxID=2804958 RepID=A0AA38TYX2_9AGAR|nr:hypothetical protein GGU10DRAFT_26054 [Lentinula aff. detonsa]
MASKAATHYLQFDIQWASIALIWYDYALTFPMEVEYLWTTKFRLSTFLYILCRYALLANTLYLVDIAGKLTENCNTWYQFIGALSVLGRAAVIVVFTGRTWAVWGKNRIVLVYMSILGATCVALDITHVPGLRCTGGSSIPIIRCVQAFKAHGKSMKEQKEGFQYLLFEQGIFYFSIVSLFTTAAVILNFQAPSGFFQRLLNAFTLPLSGLLTARLLLHLRQWEYMHSPAAMTIHNGGQDQFGTEFSFRAASVALSTMITSDFGSDPVARGPNRKNARGDDFTPFSPSHISTRPDIESQSTPELVKSEGSTESVKEGKKPVRVRD